MLGLFYSRIVRIHPDGFSNSKIRDYKNSTVDSLLENSIIRDLKNPSALGGRNLLFSVPFVAGPSGLGRGAKFL